MSAHLLEDFGSTVDADHTARSHQSRQIHRDRARSAAHIEQIESRSKGGQEIAGRVLRCSPRVTPKHRFMMPVCIDLVCHRLLEPAEHDRYLCIYAFPV